MKIIIKSLANPEDNAMLQALYSRSAESVTTHLKKVEQTGSGKFMSQYYLGYGHASIGDCGTDTMYIEGVSMLAAKAIEDNPLFAGQECSSRYIDFSTQDFWNPFRDSAEAKAIIDLYAKFREFYTSSLEPLKEALRERFPKKEGDKDAVYEKAIAARAFDILRGFLPAGATTNVAWSFRLSNADEHLRWMMHHPLEEVRRIGTLVYGMLRDKYPNSFHEAYADVGEVEYFDDATVEKALIEIEGETKYAYLSQSDNFYLDAGEVGPFTKLMLGDPNLGTQIEIEPDFFEVAQIWPSYQQRVKRTKLPKHSPVTHRIMRISGFVDFGSFRDIQRHRNMDCAMPLLTGQYGLHPWYYQNLTEELRRKAYILLNEVEAVYNKLQSTHGYFDLQYIVPMGFCVELVVRCNIGQAVYLAELRSGKTVHATLRPLAQAIGESLVSIGVPVFYDSEESDWTVKRGEQDIVAKT